MEHVLSSLSLWHEYISIAYSKLKELQPAPSPGLTVTEHSGKWFTVWTMWTLLETPGMQRKWLQINHWNINFYSGINSIICDCACQWDPPLILTSVLELLIHILHFIVSCHILSYCFSQRIGRADQMIRVHSCICKTHGLCKTVIALLICFSSTFVLSLHIGDCIQNIHESVYNFAEAVLLQLL